MLDGGSYPTSPSIKEYTDRVPGRPGLISYGSDLNERRFELKCAFIEDTKTNLYTARDNLNALLFDENMDPASLTLEEDSPKYYNVKYSGEIIPETHITAELFTLPFVAYDPIKYASITAFDPTQVYAYDTGLQYDNGLYYDNPEGFTWQYTKQRTGLYNYSPFKTPLQVVIDGPVVNPRITNETTGKTMTIGGTFTASERLYIDCKKKLIFKTTTAITDNYFIMPNFVDYYRSDITSGNLFSSWHGDFINLVKGDNSLLFEGGTPNANVTLYWKHQFI